MTNGTDTIPITLKSYTGARSFAHQTAECYATDGWEVDTRYIFALCAKQNLINGQ